jgi:RNA polymerase sigma factor (sigma-70 family)
MSQADHAAFERWVRHRDAGAFRELVLRHAGMVYGTCRRVLGDPGAAEDAAQECFEVAARARQAPDRSTVGAWLHGIAVNRARQHIRGDRRRRDREARYAAEQPEASEAAWDDLYEYVDAAVAELPADIQGPIVEHFLGGRSQADIAQESGIPPRTVSDRIQRGIGTIRESLTRRGISVGTVALGGMMTAHMAEAAPATLTETLGKLALAGTGSSAAPAGATSALGGMTMKLAIGGAVAVTLAVTGMLLRPSNEAPPTPPPEPIQTAVAEPDPVSPEPEAALAVEDVSAADAAEEEPQRYSAVEGTVVNEAGKPLAAARVLLAVTQEADEWFMRHAPLNPNYLHPARVFEAQTDYRGRFIIQDIPYEGKNIARVTARAKGYAGYRKYVTLTFGETTQQKLMELEAGRPLLGRVLALDGSPVTDALIVPEQVWRSRGNRYLSGGMGLTDSKGRFTIHVSEEAQWCDLRVNSQLHGQCFFLRQPATGEHLILKMLEFASLRGTVTWSDGRPAEGLHVGVSGFLPEPDFGFRSLGMLPRTTAHAVIDSDGRYTVDGLYPGLNCQWSLYDDDPYNEGRYLNVGPTRDRFVFEPGQVEEWNAVITGAIVLEGNVRTETSSRPAKKTWVHVLKDDKQISHGFGESVKDDGSFSVRLTAGSGLYTVFASAEMRFENKPPPDYLARYAWSRELEGGESISLDLVAPEPLRMPIRVTDPDGNSPGYVRIQPHIMTPGGRRLGHGDSYKLDSDGRTEVMSYAAASDFWIELSRGVGMNAFKIESEHYAGELGETLPEAEFILDAMCGIRGTMLFPDGSPVADTRFKFEVTYDDGVEQELSLSTSRKGSFSCPGGLRARTFTLYAPVPRDLPYLPVQFEPITGVSGETIELGDIVLEPAPAVE